MMKRTHMSVALLITSPMLITNPISIIGVLGSTIPDIDYKIGLEHRTITHSLMALGVSTVIMYVVFPTAALVWFIAYLSHLVLDSCTIKGVPFLYPFNKRYMGYKKFRSGGREDLFIALIMVYLIMEWIGSH